MLQFDGRLVDLNLFKARSVWQGRCDRSGQAPVVMVDRWPIDQGAKHHELMSKQDGLKTRRVPRPDGKRRAGPGMVQGAKHGFVRMKGIARLVDTIGHFGNPQGKVSQRCLPCLTTYCEVSKIERLRV